MYFESVGGGLGLLYNYRYLKREGWVGFEVFEAASERSMPCGLCAFRSNAAQGAKGDDTISVNTCRGFFLQHKLQFGFAPSKAAAGLPGST